MRKLNVVVEKSTPAELEDLERFRPKTRADCIDTPRPCPFVSCRHNLYLDVVGQYIRTDYDCEVEDMPPGTSNCSLDYEDGGTWRDVANTMNVTHQVIDNTVTRLMEKVARGPRPPLQDLFGRFLDPLARK